ncbi:Ig domain-containing protein [Candidatus Saccharibacteria bacterium]|nr:Ig domain-containing protein [Candidatus Saccharibacteria bacterium]
MCEDNSLPTEVLEAAGCFDNTTDSLPDFIVNILIAIIAIVGIISVIYVVIGGIKYIKSSGNSEEVKTAKNTIIFASIGIAVTALAFAIVNFSISLTGRGASGGTTTASGQGETGGTGDSANQSAAAGSNDEHADSIHLLRVTQINVNDEPITLRVSVKPSSIDKTKLTWTSSNPTVATVDSDGTVTPKSDGTTTVTVTTPSGSSSSTEVTVTPPILAESVLPSTKTLKIGVGDKYTLVANVFPNNATNKAVTWTSSDESVATVDSKGVVKAKKEGTATIAAETSNGIKGSTTVTVSSSSNVIESGKPVAITQSLLDNLKRYHQTNYTDMKYSIYSPTACGSGKRFYSSFGVGGGSCGPASYLAGAYVLTGKHVDYMTFMREAVDTGLLNCRGGGSMSVVATSRYKSFYENKYGVSVDRIPNNWDSIVKELKKGNVLIHYVERPPSLFASHTHFVASISYRENNGGEIYVWNPNTASNRNKGNCDKGECWYNKAEFTANVINAHSTSPWIMRRVAK